MKAPKSTSWIESLKRGTLVLDKAGTLLSARVNGQPMTCPPGRSFYQWLVEQEPSWAERISPEWDPDQFPLFLPLPTSFYGFACGLLCEAHEEGDHWFLSIVLELSEESNLAEDGLQPAEARQTLADSLFRRYQQTQLRLDHYLQNFPGIYFSQKADFSFHFIGSEFEAWIKQPFDSQLQSGAAFLDLIHPQDRDFFQQQVAAHAEDPGSFSLKYRLGPLPDGQIIYIQDIRKRVTTASGLVLGYEGVWMNTTNQSMAEDRLITVSWKENVSLITSGLAHDFRNIISGIFSLAELVADTCDGEAPFRESLLHIKEYSNKALKLVHRIVELNRSEPGNPALQNFQSLLEEETELLRAYLPRNIRLQVSTGWEDEEVPVYMDKVEFERALLNLAINARDALPERGGVIEIQVEKIGAGDKAFVFKGSPHPDWAAPRDGIHLIFSDNGCGMPKHALKRAFHAFYTTKESHKGSGLGLFSVKEFIEKAGGSIAIESIESVGTSIHFYLPCFDFEDSTAMDQLIATSGPEEDVPSPGSRPRIALLGEGNLDELDFVQALRNREIEVICFPSTRQFRQFLEETEKAPDALIHFSVDVPTGPDDQFSDLKRLLPDIKVIHYCVGASDHPFPEESNASVDRVIASSVSVTENVKQVFEILQ